MMKLLGVLLLGSLGAMADGKGELIVKVTNLRSDKGTVLISVYQDKTGFLRDAKHGLRTVSATITGGSATAVFGNLASGTYAIAAIHDENRNGKLDGTKEGYGTSGSNSGASFEDAKFAVDGSAKTIEIPLHY
jgi:uncharacterized protein (DUF2141 family)